MAIYCGVIFATIAFDMGVSIPDSHTVIRIGPSSSVDSYVQESAWESRKPNIHFTDYDTNPLAL